MIIFAQTSQSVGFYVRPAKRKCVKLGCNIWHFHWCVWHISDVLDMILTISPLLLSVTFSILTLMHHTIFTWWVRKMFLNSLLRRVYLLTVEVCISICVPSSASPGSFYVFVNIDRNRFSVVFKTLTTSLLFPGDPTPWSMITLYACAKIDIKYSTVAHLYCSIQPYIFSQIVIISAKHIFLFLTVQ